jgi:hypothetical protein
MSETPQERVEKWLDHPQRLVHPEVREAIRAVLAENASVSRAAGYLSDLATWWVAKAEQAEAEREEWRGKALALADERDALRAEVERLTRDREAGEGHWIGKLKAAEAERDTAAWRPDR